MVTRPSIIEMEMSPEPRAFGLYLMGRSRLQKIWHIFKRACISGFENNCFGLAKGAAYSALLSLFPVLTTMAAILVQTNAVAISKSLSNLVFEVVPPGTEEVVLYNFTERGQRPIWLLILATLLALWAASGLMMTLMQGFQAAYHIRTGRSFWRQRGVATLLVPLVALPIVTASALLVFGTRTEHAVFTVMGVTHEGEQLRGWILLIGAGVRYLVALAAIAVATAVLYYVGPPCKVALRDVWQGALLASTLSALTTTGFGWYVRNIANYNVLYGSIGASVALLVWMYLLSIIALLGCEYNAEREHLRAIEGELP
jgi:membrane protein